MAEQPSTLRSELNVLLLVALGAVPGALIRWQVALHLADQNLLVNSVGAGLLGLLAALPAAPRRQLLLGIGFCGSFTTFSSWMLTVARDLAAGNWGEAIGLLGLTLGLGLGCASLGFGLGRWLKPPEQPRSEP